MKRTATFISLIVCSVFLFSCEKDGGTNDSYLEGYYILQTAEGKITASGGYESVWSYNDRTREFFADGKEFNENWLYQQFDDETRATIKSRLIEEYVCFPSGLDFHKDGTVLVKLLFCWLDDSGMEYWYDEEDLEDFQIQVKYTIEKSVITLNIWGVRGYSYKIVSNSGSILKLELTDKSLAELNKEYDNNTRMEWSKAVYQRQ